MCAFAMTELEQVGFTEKPIPDPGLDNAIVTTTNALVCTTNVHTVSGAICDRKNFTLGHEGVGVIYQRDSAVKGFRETPS
jgi:D-arabinose 1-dehydrogenase-like Zn-dependent alcohol dehydrogenase